ncbi:MAG TPA: heme-copper oxidase subunit III [Methylomirabilota bacterium]|nr:heme-copper oxidase subunit III [Methylomirabilota bacterium]
MSGGRARYATPAQIEVDRTPHVRLAGGPPPPFSQPPVSNARLGMLMLIAAETMLFAGLIGAYLLFRLGSVAWPSAHLYLPLGVTWLNTVVLLASGYTMHQAVQAGRANIRPTLIRYLGLTTLLGVCFLSIQGYEWLQLIHDGLTISTGIYGATFYTLIGCHALHVFAAVVWLSIVLWRARTSISSTHVHICGLYWRYVCALWVVLFSLVYLN